jgi:hypothetical protein
MTRNVECTGHPHSTFAGCGWTGERYPAVQPTRAPGNLWDRRVFTDEYMEAVAKKPCPKCGGLVMPTPTDDIVWPAELMTP